MSDAETKKTTVKQAKNTYTDLLGIGRAVHAIASPAATLTAIFGLVVVLAYSDGSEKAEAIIDSIFGLNDEAAHATRFNAETGKKEICPAFSHGNPTSGNVLIVGDQHFICGK